MFVNVTLCKTPINTTDTLFFANAEAQKAYFNGIQEKHTYAQSSFNGSRSFRIPVNYLQAVNTHYNYMYYFYAGRVWYCFIDNYTYINDTSCEVNVTLDFVQTFMFDITWKSSRIASFTWKKSHFENGYVPYSNKFPSASKAFTKLYDIATTIKYGTPTEHSKLMYVCVTVDKNAQFTGDDKWELYFEKFGNKNCIIEENGAQKISDEFYAIRGGTILPYYTFIFPVFAGDLEVPFVGYNYYPPNSPGLASRDIIGLIKALSQNIIDISVVATEIGAFEMTDPKAEIIQEIDSNFFDGAYGITRAAFISGKSDGSSRSKINAYVAYVGTNKNVPISTRTISLKDLELCREPYKSIVIGNSVSNEEIELSDCDIDSNNEVTIKIYQEIVPPFITTVEVVKGDETNSYDKTLRFYLDLSKPVPYEVTAWANYLATNSANVNDGLKTKHGYEKEIAKRNMTNTAAQGAVGIGVGIIGSIIGIRKGSSQALVGGISQMASGASQIADSQVQYENTLTNMEKERALLEISWNDIKSAPSEAVNALSPSFSAYTYDNLYASVYMCEAVNIEAIKKYHKIYGYQTEEVVEADELKQQHTVFDYIRFEDANFITNLPHNTHQIIKKIFESGVRFWYDEYNFLNFDIDNLEYQGA